MLENIKKSSYKVKMNLREVHRITQWKDDCVYRTRSLGMIICKPDYEFLIKSVDIQLGSVSTRISKELYQ